MEARMSRSGGLAVVGALVVGLVTGPGGAAAGAEPGREELRGAMIELTRSGAAGVQVRIHDEQGAWNGSAGVRELDGGKVPSTGRFRVGSITKMFVSTVVLQLVDEGVVALDAPVDDYLPEFGLDRRITVRMLLQHTSGLFNYTGEPNPDGTLEPGIPMLGREFERNRFRTYRPEELVAVALSKPARFEPGTSWSYSNTNYVLAGQLIERMTGTPYAVQVRKRILAPLGLRETVLPGTRIGIRGPHAHGYYAYQHQGQLRVVDGARVNPSWGSAAGEIISTTRDLDTFVNALLDGELLPADLLAQMRDAVPAGALGAYGLGLEVLDGGPECGGVYEGHTGGVPGYSSYVLRSTDGTRRLEMSVTLGPVDYEDPETSERYFLALNDVLVAALCDLEEPAGRTAHEPFAEVAPNALAAVRPGA
jgi:D-alanyl-D-alanine carboxypeptidase